MTPLRFRVRRFALNDRGRDLVVGDVHGQIEELERLLAAVGFNGARDRLFIAGDLVDDGPESDGVAHLLARPGIHAVLGDHDILALVRHGRRVPGFSIADIPPPDTPGTDFWWCSAPRARVTECLDALGRLPLAIEVATPRGAVGIVHADIPLGTSWAQFTQDVRAGHGPTWRFAVSSRIGAHAAEALALDGLGAPHPYRVEGLHLVFFGHTASVALGCRPYAIANRRFIDTGAKLPHLRDRDLRAYDHEARNALLRGASPAPVPCTGELAERGRLTVLDLASGEALAPPSEQHNPSTHAV